MPTSPLHLVQLTSSTLRAQSEPTGPVRGGAWGGGPHLKHQRMSSPVEKDPSIQMLALSRVICSTVRLMRAMSMLKSSTSPMPMVNLKSSSMVYEKSR
ncbi:hypothetical protein CRUP_001281 [Coryphaenoides rupestris]|nr:hypothetical protein CRUP_001281 [Coryphaenoides rupestris]